MGWYVKIIRDPNKHRHVVGPPRKPRSVDLGVSRLCAVKSLGAGKSSARLIIPTKEALYLVAPKDASRFSALLLPNMTPHALDPALAVLHAPARISTEEKYHHSDTDLTSSRPQSMNDNAEDGLEHAEAEQKLPPVDGGRHAWCFLASVFLFEAVIWGL